MRNGCGVEPVNEPQVDGYHTTLPDGRVAVPTITTSNLPSPLEGPSCWTGEAITPTAWFRQLNHEELDALEGMVDKARPLVGDDPNVLLSMTSVDFSPGAFAAVLNEIDFDLCHGRGFSVIRTLPVHRWTPIETLIAYWSISCQLGIPLSSNAGGDMIGHVVDLGADYERANIHGYDTNAKLSYHADQCDVVGLLCRQTARTGGVSKLVSTAAVHNEILARRPDLLSVSKGTFVFQLDG